MRFGKRKSGSSSFLKSRSYGALFFLSRQRNSLHKTGCKSGSVGRWMFMSLVVTTILSCTPEEEMVSNSGALGLWVSTDTVLFDTLLTDRGSITRRFRIYNPNEQAVQFDRIALAKGEQSDYQLVINGREGTEVRNELLFGKDSLQVLVSAFIDPQNENTPYLVKDSVVFDWNGNTGHVKLVAYGQDAVFVNGATLCNVTWTNERPYVIYNYALIDSLCWLNVQQGAQIFMDNDAALLVKGTFLAQGTSDERITIRHTRFDNSVETSVGLWDGIYFLEGSSGNQINYTDISNGSIGLRIGTPDDDHDFDVEVSNSSIGHMSVAGILAFTSEVKCTNCLVYDCAEVTVANYAGGTYQYDHCTLVNFPNLYFREDPLMQFSNFIELGDGSFIRDSLSVTIRNSIIWGTEDEELIIYDDGFEGTSTEFISGILRTEQQNDFFNSQEDNFPGFLEPQMFDYRLDSLSPAIGNGTDIEVSFDLLGNSRIGVPDIGCYEFLED